MNIWAMMEPVPYEEFKKSAKPGDVFYCDGERYRVTAKLVSGEIIVARIDDRSE